MDTRQRDYKTLRILPRGACIHWVNVRTFAVQELSSFAWPIVYRVTTADGYYPEGGERVYFTPAVDGLSTQKKVSEVVVRLAVFLSIIAGLGYRKASWLREVLFRIAVSKSAIARWVNEIADTLPSADELVKPLHHQYEITEAHLDELFPLGEKACVLVLRERKNVRNPQPRYQGLVYPPIPREGMADL